MKACTVVAAILLTVGLASAAPQRATVYVAGREAVSDPSAVELEGHLMLPSSFLSTRLGVRVEAVGTDEWRLYSYQRCLKVRRGSSRYVVGTTPVTIAQVPIILGGRLYVPAEIIAQAFGIAYNRTGERRYELTPAGASLLDVRLGRNENNLRLVLDLTGPAAYWVAQSGDELTIELPPPDPIPGDWNEARLFSFDHPLELRVKIRPGPANWMRVEVWGAPAVPPTVFTLANPYRLVLDIPLVSASGTTRGTPSPRPTPASPAMAPSVERPAVTTPWEERSFQTPRGPVRVLVLTCTPTAVRPVLAGPTIRERAPVSLIAAQHKAIAAVNGGYFDWSGPPLGMLVIDGEWIKHPMLNRCVLGITTAGQALMGRLRFKSSVTIERVGRFTLAGLNSGHAEADTAILYTRRWGRELVVRTSQAVAVIDAQGRVCQVAEGPLTLTIPAEGYILSATGQLACRLAQARESDRVQLDLDTDPPWPRLRHALGAGPQLLRNGVIEVTADEERFRPDVRRVCPRPAVGINRDGNLVIAAAEGSPAGGVSLTETASIMQRLGCREAMALDGGGSTTVVGAGRVLNRPTDGVERPVSNALLIVGKPISR